MSTMKKHDIILIGILVVIVLFSFGGFRYYQSQNKNEPRFAEITQNNILIERLDLNAVAEPREIILPGPYHEVVRIEKGRIRFLHTDCPDQICVRSGWLEDPGDIAICLPNKAVINVTE